MSDSVDLPVRVEIPEHTLRRIIEEAVQRVLYAEQAGLVDPRHFARVQVTMEDGSQMRGVVYPVERTE